MIGKIVITIALICLSFMDAEASKRQRKAYTAITYGVEWSYVGTFGSYIHQNFYSTEGSRVDIKGTDYFHKSEAEIYAHIGANINHNWNLALYAGYTKIAHIHYAIPVSIRATRLFKTNKMNDRWMSFIEGGTGAALMETAKPIYSGKIGGGYRFSLSRRTKLDIIIAYKLTYTHPEIEYYSEKIPQGSIMRNNGLYSSFTVGFSITL